MDVLAEAGNGQAVDVVVTLAVIGTLVWVLRRAFRRRIGGAGGGSEKAIVPALWLLAAVVAGLLLAAR